MRNVLDDNPRWGWSPPQVPTVVQFSIRSRAGFFNLSLRKKITGESPTWARLTSTDGGLKKAVAYGFSGASKAMIINTAFALTFSVR